MMKMPIAAAASMPPATPVPTARRLSIEAPVAADKKVKFQFPQPERSGQRVLTLGGIDARLAFRARHVCFDHRPFGGMGRQPFVPEADRQFGKLFKIAYEGAYRLGPRPFGAVHVARQPDYDARNSVFVCEFEKVGRIGGELAAHDDVKGRGDEPAPVGQRDADRLCARIEAHQCSGGRDMSGKYLDGMAVAGHLAAFSLRLTKRSGVESCSGPSMMTPYRPSSWLDAVHAIGERHCRET